VCLALLLPLIVARAAHAQTDPLPSWNEGEVKQAIVKFVQVVTSRDSAEYVAPEARIATFDNDGTLWSEQPMYFQGLFAFDRVKALAPKHPEWTSKQPFKGILENDMKAVAATGEKGLAEVQRPYNEMVFQPMLELLAYLRANGFKTFIVSGGGADFMRVFTEQVYGIPPEQVVGSVGETRFEMRNGKPVLVKLPKLNLIDDKAGKPVGIHRFIGRRPILAFGNSDGDQQMLQWTAAGDGARFMGLVRHTDAQREWAYDRQSSIGRLDKALDEATARGWSVVDMKRDWKKIYPFE